MKLVAGRGAGLGSRVTVEVWLWEMAGSVLFPLLGWFHPPRPSPTTGAKECAWERWPEAGEGAKPPPPGGSTQVGWRDMGLRRARDPEHPQGHMSPQRRLRHLPNSLTPASGLFWNSPSEGQEFSVLGLHTMGQGLSVVGELGVSVH